MQRRSLMQGVLGSVGLMLTSLPLRAEDVQDPYDWVVGVSNGILDAIRADVRLQQGNQDALQELVDRYIMPNVDFPMITRMTVGPRWRQATPEERIRLQKGFEKLLMRVYSGALKTVKDNVCELRPTRNRRVSDELVVRTLLKSTGSQDIALDYRIYRNKRQNAWKIVDVNVEGIWMVENYRAQFASTLSNDGIQGLIKLLEEKSEEIVKTNKPAIAG